MAARVRVGINGFGRIGRCALRAGLGEAGLEFVAVNDLTDNTTLAHLFKYDSVHRTYRGEVEATEGGLKIDGDEIRVFRETDPAKLPWGELGVDIVVEATGRFTKRADAAKHLAAGAKKVIISAPGDKDVDGTFVFGVNHHTLTSAHTVISNASCTTNCLAPMVKVLHERIGVVSGLMTTIHAYTNDQVLTDVYHEDLRRARSATMSQIPTKTGAAAAVGLVLPELAGRLDGFAMRIPTINVSTVDLTFVAERKTSKEEIDSILKAASQGELKGVLDYNDEPLVSVDFNHNPASSIYDAGLTKVMEGTLVKVCAWYDNEWGFSNRMLDTAIALVNAK